MILKFFSTLASAIFFMIIIMSPSYSYCWLFSPRYQPYYYPFPYPVPASAASTPTISSTVGAVPTTTSTGSSATSDPYYNYNWYNYNQNYPNSGSVLFPSNIPAAGATGSILPGIGLSSFLPSSGSLLRSWWSRKFTKLGLRSPGSAGGSSNGIGPPLINGVIGTPNPAGGSGYATALQTSPCQGYWTNGIGSPCISSNLCCYPLVVQTTIDTDSKLPPQQQQQPQSNPGTYTKEQLGQQTVINNHNIESITYPSTGYYYRPTGYKSSSATLRPQASESIEEVVDSS